MPRARELAAATVFLLLGATSTHAECPGNSIRLGGYDVVFPTADPTAQYAYSDTKDTYVPWNKGELCENGCYDLPHGWLEARGFNYLYGPGDTYVSVSDEYVVQGAGSAPLTFELVLLVHATIETEGTVWVQASVAGIKSPALETHATGDQELAMPVTASPGAPFLVSVAADAEGGHYDGTGHAQVAIRFRGLSRDYVVTSCQGFDEPTPAGTATWGSVKAAYR
jgi:hypothetical protein